MLDSRPPHFVPAFAPLDRGVWTAPYRDDRGRELVAVVTSQGRRIADVPIPIGADKACIEQHLELMLDMVDPLRPRLALLPPDH